MSLSIAEGYKPLLTVQNDSIKKPAVQNDSTKLTHLSLFMWIPIRVITVTSCNIIATDFKLPKAVMAGFGLLSMISKGDEEKDELWVSYWYLIQFPVELCRTEGVSLVKVFAQQKY